MFNKNNWREPIYKEDVKHVILNGLIAAILGGILGGALDYLFNVVLKFPISFSLIIMVLFIGYRTKKGYYSYHILFPVLAILFLILSIFFCIYSFYAISYMVIGEYRIYLIFAYPSFWLSFITAPISALLFGINNSDVGYIIYGVIDLIFYICAFWFVYRMVKGKN
jgi:hypothetical protein